MKKSLTLLFISTCISICVYAQDWTGVSVPADPGNGKVWQIQNQHSDDFNYNGKNATFTGKWLDNHRAGWSGPGETQFSSNHSEVSGGNLLIKAGRVTNISGKTVYCGHVTTKTPIIYPVFTEVKMRCSGINLASNFWLLSADDVNEIDVTETYGAEDPAGKRMATNYHIFQRSPFLDLANSPKAYNSQGNVFLRDDFHRFGLHWVSATEFKFYFDGVLVRTLNTSNDLTDPRNRFFDQALHIIMNTELHSWKSNAGIRPSDQELNNNNINKMYIDWVRTYKPVTATQAAYPNGTPHPIPGTIEAEHYDTGGEGVAYHDNDAANNGNNVLREDQGVDIEARDGGISVGWTGNGEWLEYTVNATSGTYDLEARIATITTGKSIVAKLDGVTLGTFNLPNTGNWGAFQTVKINNIAVSGGNNKVLRLEFVGGGTNINWVNFTSVNPSTGITLGNGSISDGIHDGWNSNMVINETDTYTNTSGSQESISIDKFNFYAWQNADPVTPFVVKVNGDNNFTILKIGTTRASSSYNIGANSLDFRVGGTAISINNGEKIAIGFLDANANGTGSGAGSVIPFDQTSPDQIWYTGGSAGSNSGSVSEGSAPTTGTNIVTNLTRNYHFNIEMSVGATLTQPSAVARTTNVIKDTPNTFEPNQALIYPNPLYSGHFTLDLSQYESGADVTVFDTMGRQVYKTVAEPRKLLNLNSNIFPAKGLYIFNINSTTMNKKLRLIVK